MYVYNGKDKFVPKEGPETLGRELRPCGTYAAADRHKRRGEELDPACKLALRNYYTEQRARKRAKRAQGVTPPRRRPRQPCGTYGAAHRHYAYKEPLCEPCKQAKAEYEKNLRASRPKSPPRVAKCGTYSGALKHRRNGEKVCESCRVAANEYMRARRHNKKKAAH